MKAFKKILCPVDFSLASYEALRVAVELADANITEICVLHVVPVAGSITTTSRQNVSTQNEVDRRAVTVRNLCAIVADKVPPSLHSRPLLKEGAPSEEIVRAAKEENADLIVLTTHGAGTQGLETLGEVVKAVANNALCPVLTINPFDHSSYPGFQRTKANIKSKAPEESKPVAGR